ncbi:MAG TPA: hypothetical protein VL882_14215 [Vicinamibacterales bacterium]|jgi:hypothetical protein|nr:hypothetical protein [Vicinamibacterales bacterium]
MRASGGRGADAWMLVIPVIALVVAGSMSAGGLNAVLLTIESTIRNAFNAGIAFVTKLL